MVIHETHHEIMFCIYALHRPKLLHIPWIVHWDYEHIPGLKFKQFPSHNILLWFMVADEVKHLYTYNYEQFLMNISIHLTSVFH